MSRCAVVGRRVGEQHQARRRDVVATPTTPTATRDATMINKGRDALTSGHVAVVLVGWVVVGKLVG